MRVACLWGGDREGETEDRRHKRHVRVVGGCGQVALSWMPRAARSAYRTDGVDRVEADRAEEAVAHWGSVAPRWTSRPWARGAPSLGRVCREAHEAPTRGCLEHIPPLCHTVCAGGGCSLSSTRPTGGARFRGALTRAPPVDYASHLTPFAPPGPRFAIGEALGTALERPWPPLPFARLRSPLRAIFRPGGAKAGGGCLGVEADMQGGRGGPPAWHKR